MCTGLPFEEALHCISGLAPHLHYEVECTEPTTGAELVDACAPFLDASLPAANLSASDAQVLRACSSGVLFVSGVWLSEQQLMQQLSTTEAAPRARQQAHLNLCGSLLSSSWLDDVLLKREFFLHCSRLAFWHDQRVLRSLDSFHFSNAEWAWPGLHARTRR